MSNPADLVRAIAVRELEAINARSRVAPLDDEDTKRFEVLTRCLRHARDIAAELDQSDAPVVDLDNVIALAERRR